MNERLFDEVQEFRVVLDPGLELLLMRVAKVCKRHILLGRLRRNPSSLARWVFYVMHRSWGLELGTTELHIHIHNDSNEAICLDKQ